MLSLSPADIARLTDYVAGELTSDAMAEAERWIAEDDQRKEFVSYLQRSQNNLRQKLAARIDVAGNVLALTTEVIRREQVEKTSRLENKALSHHVPHNMISHKIGRTMHAQSGGNTAGRVASWSIAAALLCVVGWSLVRPSRPTGVPHPERTYATHAAERVTVSLTDGTRVTLAPNSTLTLARDFGTEYRTLQLTGEAFFEVSAKSRAPFVVRTGTVFTRVLGTTFAVRRYATTDPVQVVVQSGKVVSAGRRGGIVVTSGGAAFVTDSTAIPIAAHPAQYTDWTKGRLVFDRTSVAEVLSVAQRWYGYRFVLADSALAAERVTVVLKIADSADMMLQLKYVLGVAMTFHGDTITLRPSHAVKRVPQRTVFKPFTEIGR